MAVSSEFEKTVQENNVLRTRIMLKDSLLMDKSFLMFDELLKYALARGVDVWMPTEKTLEQADKPWTLDLMNYELTVLVSDFTREHVYYVKQIIKELYKGEWPVRQPATTKHVAIPEQQYTLRPSYPSDTGNGQRSASVNYDTILHETKRINEVLQNNKDKNGNRHWLYDDIERIKSAAKNIEASCEKILRRK